MSRPGAEARTLPPMSPAQLEAALLGSVDMVLSLAPDRRVLSLHVASGFHLAGVSGWLDKPFEALVCKASQAKLPSLFTLAQGTAERPARWRHLNFQTRQTSIPMLVKYFGFDGAEGGRHLIVARDLRPTVAMQARVQQALIEIERSVEDRALDPARPDLRLSDAAARIGDRPLHEIVAETARTLERLCLDEAMRRTAGDRSQAARLLGLDPAEFDLRLRML